MATSSSSADNIAYSSPSSPSSTSSSVRPGFLNLTEPTCDCEIPAVPSVLSLTNGAKNFEKISYPEGISSSQQRHRYTMLQSIDTPQDNPKSTPDCSGIESSTSLQVTENRWERNTISLNFGQRGTHRS
ncbi:hypothetical protein H0H93_013324 [Arthromyces matolae]|nr:hypothetical protein H0H93_013324 [Arthromyces matolae]